MVGKGGRHSDYRFLSNIALADIAFVARADSLPSLFESAARALTEVMVDRKTVVGRVGEEDRGQRLRRWTGCSTTF